MIDSERFFGGCETDYSMTADRTLTARSKRVQVLDPQSSGLAVILPDARTLETGAPRFYIVNESGSYSLALKDDGGNTLATLAVNDCAKVNLVSDATANGIWQIAMRDVVS